MAPVGEAVGVQTARGSVESLPRRDWWRVLVVAAGVAFLYYPVIAKLVFDWWTDPNFSHGFFVPLFSAYLIAEKRRDLKVLPAEPLNWGLLVIVGSIGLLIVGTLGAELFVARVSLVCFLAGLVLFFGGRKWMRALLFPWLFLFLMIPIPAIIFNQITFPLQLLASRLASVLLPVFQVPVLREGNVIQLPSMPLEVAEACSGIRSLLSLGTLAVIYGYFLESSLWRRVVLVIAAVPIAVAANAFRVVGTGLAVQYWDPIKGLGFFHEFSGWMIFMVSVVMLFIVHKAMSLFAKSQAGEVS